MDTILWLLGVLAFVAGLYFVYELFTKKPGTPVLHKVLYTVLILCVPYFVGLAIYYFCLREKLK